MSLHFAYHEAQTLLLTVMLVAFMLIATNGRSNWFVGVLLLSTYIVIAIAFWEVSGDVALTTDYLGDSPGGTVATEGPSITISTPESS